MEDQLEPASDDTEETEAPPFFTFVIGEGGRYELSTNLGDYWQWHVLKIAAAIRKELE